MIQKRRNLSWSSRGFTALAVAAVLLVPASLIEAGRASSSRPGRPSSASSPSGGGTRTRPVGQATYGNYRHGGYHGHYYRHGYYGAYGFYPGYYWGFGAWPYWGWGDPRPYFYYAGDRRADRNAPVTVETDVKPGRAEIRVDGRYVGEARDFNGRWDLLWLEAGTHDIEFTRDGYQTLRRWIDVPAGGYIRIEERLAKGEGIDPRSTEAPPEPPAEVAKTRAEASTRVAEAPRSSGTLRRGLLRFEVAPTDAAVYLDGEFLAQADELSRLHGAIPVAEGVHTIEVVRPGYEDRRIEVEVAGQTPIRIEVELERR